MSDPYATDVSRLQAVIARWLADHGVPDPAIGAVELVHIVRGHGWRVVEGLKPPPDPTPTEPSSRPTDRPEVAEALARCAAASEKFRTAEPNPERTT